MAVTTEQVKAIIATSKTDLEVEAFITMAQSVVTEELTGSGLSSGRLDLITTWLAAHYLSISQDNGGIRRSKLGDADESYVVPKEGFGLASTHYGQQALALDTTGTLAATQASGGLKAEFRVIKAPVCQ